MFQNPACGFKKKYYIVYFCGNIQTKKLHPSYNSLSSKSLYCEIPFTQLFFFHSLSQIKACPYFRTPANIERCKIMTLDEYGRKLKAAEEAQQQLMMQNQTLIDRRRDSIRRNIGELFSLTHLKGFGITEEEKQQNLITLERKSRWKN
jgi:hypothetical protein